MKIRVAKDERWPDFCISNSEWEPEIEITDEEFAKIQAAEKLYEEAQAILARAYER